MNVWKLTAVNNLVKSTEEPRPEAGKRRVRVTMVYVNPVDGMMYSGKKKVRYPLVPGRFAVGLLADEGSAEYPKGARVLLHSYLPAFDTGTEERDFSEDDFRVCGHTSDGFLRDFVYAHEDEMTLLPDAVSDEKALLLYHVALAQAAVETLDARRGQHIAVIGANILGLFVSKLLIYRQAAPILIDNRKDRLDFARSCGVYYTSLNDGSLMDMLGTVTGGRLADGVVFMTNAGFEDASLPVKLCASDKNLAYCGLDGEAVSLDLGELIRKRLTVHGVSDGTDNLEMAINLAANRAVDLSAFHYNVVPANDAGKVFAELAQTTERPLNEIYILNLV